MSTLPLGSLSEYISDGNLLPEGAAQRISDQLLGTLNYYHSKHLIHGDIKPGNILVESRLPLAVKLIHSGLPEHMTTKQGSGPLSSATLAYSASKRFPTHDLLDSTGANLAQPDMVWPDTQPRSLEIDIWSLGSVLFQAITGCRIYHPTPLAHSMIVHSNTRSSQLHKCGISPVGINFVSGMLSRHSWNSSRGRIIEFRSHKWLRGVLESESSSAHELRQWIYRGQDFERHETVVSKQTETHRDVVTKIDTPGPPSNSAFDDSHDTCDQNRGRSSHYQVSL